MKPYIFNDVFEVTKGLVGEVIFFEDKKILCVDNFLQDFIKAQQLINAFPPGDWCSAENTRHHKDYYDCKIFLNPPKSAFIFKVAANMLKQQYGEDNAELTGFTFVNWFKQINEKRNDFACPHTDDYASNMQLYTFLLYLNSEETSSGGTIFFNNIKQNFTDEHVDYWSADKTAWQNIGHINMKPNRLIVFPSKYYHAAYHPHDAFFDSPRLTLAFQLGVPCI
jgi:hypothetical protein